MRITYSILGLATAAQAKIGLNEAWDIYKSSQNNDVSAAGRSEIEELDPIPWTSSPDFVDQNGNVKYKIF